jgi:hypothetical protein
VELVGIQGVWIEGGEEPYELRSYRAPVDSTFDVPVRDR